MYKKINTLFRRLILVLQSSSRIKISAHIMAKLEEEHEHAGLMYTMIKPEYFIVEGDNMEDFAIEQ